MQTLISSLKRVLPPKLSHSLRTTKAQIVDSDTKAFKAFLSHVRDPDRTAVDIGANMGIYAGMMARSFGTVVLAEPNPACIRYLKAVIPANCMLVECAVSDRDGFADLRVPILNGIAETTRGTISDQNDFSGGAVQVDRTVRVETKTIDSMLAGMAPLGKVVFLKVDTEGHELSSWRGAERTVAENRPALCIEIESQHGDDSHALFDSVRSHGYFAVKVSGPKLVEDARFASGRYDAILGEGDTANRYFLHEADRARFAGALS